MQQNENDNINGKHSHDEKSETNNVHFSHQILSKDTETQVDCIKDGGDDREYAVDNHKTQNAKTDAVSLAAIKLQKKIGIKHVLRQRSR